MYNVDIEMRDFYRNKVVLSSDKQKALIDKKKINVDRIKAGLQEYNEENGTDYKIVDTIVQGSVAMQTVIQAEDNDYDIDVGIVFNKDNLPEPTADSGNNTTTVKNIVYNALLKKAYWFKKDPEKRTNCIRIIYADGYHVDFAIYRRHKNDDDDYVYEHCGADWLFRNPRSITKWFKSRDKANDFNLKRVARLLKAYLKQNSSWSVPGGLIQSVLADECFQSSDRLDEMLYNTIVAIIDRLEEDTEVYNPVDVDENEEKISLLRTDDHKDKVVKMKNYLIKGINKLSILNDVECTKEQALEAWGNFFDNSYWTELADEIENRSISESYSLYKSANAVNKVYDYNETEELIDDIFPINKKYYVGIECTVEQNGFRPDSLINFLKLNKFLKSNKTLRFKVISNTVPYPYDIYWKVLNVGKEAEKRNLIRGEIRKGGSEQVEHTQFSGPHKVSCYIVKNGECVAEQTIDVPISV